MILVSCLYNIRHKPKCVALLFFYWYFPRCSLLSTSVGASKVELKIKNLRFFLYNYMITLEISCYFE